MAIIDNTAKRWPCVYVINKSKTAALLTVTQISYMPQKFSLLIRKQVEARHKNLFVRDLKSFM